MVKQFPWLESHLVMDDKVLESIYRDLCLGSNQARTELTHKIIMALWHPGLTCNLISSYGHVFLLYYHLQDSIIEYKNTRLHHRIHNYKTT